MLLGTPLQVAYATTDLSRASALLGDKFGIARYLWVGRVDVVTDAGETMILNLAHALVGPTWIELIEPIAGAVEIFRNWLPAAGFGLRLHHLGYHIADQEAWAQTMEEVRAAGIATIFSITRGPPSHACYIDTAAELGHYVEYLYFPDIAQSTLVRIPQNLPDWSPSSGSGV